MKILLTGATGFIGTWAAQRLARDGHSVVGMDLIAPETGQSLPLARFVQGDIRDVKSLREAMNGCDAILSLAAAHHDFGIERETYFDINEGASQLICDTADALGIKRICWYSSCAVYGDSPAPRDESAAPQPNNYYGSSKLAGEVVFQKWAAKGDSRSCLCIRPTITFGPGNVANMYSLIRQIASGRFVIAGTPTNIKSLSYVENLIDATMWLWLRHGAGFDIFNFVEKPDLTSVQIAEAIASGFGRKSAGVRLPMWLVRLLALPFDIATKLTGRDFSISTLRVKKLFVWETRFESEKLKQTGFQTPLSVRDGLRRMVEWYEQGGKNLPIKWRQPPSTIQEFKS